MSCYHPTRNRKPLRRSWLKKKPKPHRERSPWLPQRVRLSGPEMQLLRRAAYQRSGGQCECWMATPGKTEADWCGKLVTWISGQLHHITPRAHGGSDVIENVAFLFADHHEEIHGKPAWGRRTE